jgi:superfamily II DNA or RNA helicase
MEQRKLRDYQVNTIGAVQRHFDKGGTSTIAHLATGLGKSAIAVGVSKLFNPAEQRVMFAVHTRDLVYQMKRNYADWWPELTQQKWSLYNRPGVGIVMGSHDEVMARTIIGTPQTMSGVDEDGRIKTSDFKRLDSILKYGNIDVLIIDEAHHSVSKSYLAMRDYLAQANPNLKVVGFTATPVRTDGLALSQMYQTIAVSYDIRYGIRNKYLCNILPPKLIETGMELPNVYGVSESNIEERVKALDVNNWSEVLYNAYAKEGEDRPGVWFMPSVDHSKKFARYMSEHGIPTAHVDGYGVLDADGEAYSSEERGRIYDDYRSGKIKMLSNYNVLLEGWDAPHTSFIGYARPSSNEILLTQAIGRGTRLYPGKENLLVMDFALKGVKLLTAGTLLGHTWDDLEKDEGTLEEPVEVEVEELVEGMDMRDMSQPGSVIQGNGIVVRLGNLFRAQEEAWYYDKDNIASVSCNGNINLVIVPPYYSLASRLQEGMRVGEAKMDEQPGNAEIEAFYETLAKAHSIFSTFTLWKVSATLTADGKRRWQAPELLEREESLQLLMDFATPYLDEYAEKSLSSKQSKWRKETSATESQLKFLKQLGCTELPESKGQAAQMITHYIAAPRVQSVLDQVKAACGNWGVLKKMVAA